jgi:hypothetical protein
MHYPRQLCLCVVTSLLVLTLPLQAAEVNKRTHLASVQQVKINTKMVQNGRVHPRP